MPKMSRKSTRLQSRSKSAEQVSLGATVSRKRKAEEDPEGTMELSKRRQVYTIENRWVPISESTSVPSCTIIPIKCEEQLLSPETSPSQDLALRRNFRFENYFTTPIVERVSPLPKLDWANSQDVWQFMLRKEASYIRDASVFNRHPSLQPRMRAILLDWLAEVCEVYRLHRETFYLALDFFDRFLTCQRNIQKHQLQLIGITSLFVAAKLEEIYPPKLNEFAYVTDGACTEDEILDQELILVKSLKWDLSPVTMISWLNVYLQTSNIENFRGGENSFVIPQYSSHVFIQIARLLDLCVLDVESLEFTFSVLAASALYHCCSSRELTLAVSGFKWTDILPCVQWMTSFAVTVRELGPIQVKFFPNIPAEDSHNIQTHVLDLNILEKAQLRQEEFKYVNHGSPDPQAKVITTLTPPTSSDKKHALTEKDSSDLSTETDQHS